MLVKHTGRLPNNTNPNFSCYGQNNGIMANQCATESGSDGTFSLNIAPHCVANTTTPSPSNCVDTPPQQLQADLAHVCGTHGGTGGGMGAICDAQNCDELVSILSQSGKSCTSIPRVGSLCCASCRSGGNDTATCASDRTRCLIPLLEMMHGGCCPALTQSNTSAFTDPAVIASCHTCAETKFPPGTLAECSCCMPGDLGQFQPLAPPSFIQQVFGSCPSGSQNRAGAKVL
eukprot:m.205664 g.205664  ORF g.205664 m.205664 type:complete len:231 (-) comp23035_c0_seq1:125-817(-)